MTKVLGMLEQKKETDPEANAGDIEVDLETEIVNMTSSAAAATDPALQLLKNLHAVAKTSKLSMVALFKHLTNAVNGDRASFDELKKFPACHTMTDAVMEKSRLEEVIKELVWRNIAAGQSAFNLLTDCIGGGTDVSDEDALVSCIATKAEGQPDEQAVLFVLEQLSSSIEDT